MRESEGDGDMTSQGEPEAACERTVLGGPLGEGRIQPVKDLRRAEGAVSAGKVT